MKTIKQLEKEYILSAMERFEGNKPKVAAAMGISMKTLYNKLNEYDTENLIAKAAVSVMAVGQYQTNSEESK